MKVSMLGFGEAASAFLEGWREEGPVDARAFDIKTDGGGRESKLADYAQWAVEPVFSAVDLGQGAKTIFSLVTADQATEAARAVAAGVDGAPFFFDGNSCAPQAKTASAAAVEAAGGRYVDMAIMSSVRPLRHKAPILVSGPHAEAAVGALAALGMNANPVDGPVGRASAIKLTRSIMVKGLEALMAETLAAGNVADVTEPVIASLVASHPGIDWRRFATEGQEDMARHGRRRSEEMRAAARMLDELGLPNDMAAATALWERRIAEGFSPTTGGR